MSKRNQTTKTAVAAAQEPTKEEVALDQANLEEGKTDENESGNESAGADAPERDGAGDETSETGQEDTGAGSDSESSNEDLGEGEGQDLDGADADAKQLATALAAAVTPTPTPVVNDIPAPAITIAPVVNDLPEAAPVAAPVARQASVSLTQTPITVRTDVKAQQAGIKFQLIADRLQQYAELMAPNAAVSARDCIDQQINLWRVIDQTLKLEGAEFIQGYSILLDFVAAHRTAHFSEKYLYRRFGELPLSTADRRNFNRLLNLLVATCDRATRRLGLQQVDLQASLAGIRDTGIQQRVTEFYQI